MEHVLCVCIMSRDHVVRLSVVKSCYVCTMRHKHLQTLHGTVTVLFSLELHTYLTGK